MMRSPSKWAVAVRKPDGEIAEVVKDITSPMARRRVFRLPVIRGVIALGESLAIGFRALAISANYAAQDPDAKEGEVQTEITRGQILFSFAIAIGFALMLFKVTPALITSWLPIDTTGSFVVIEGVIRVAIFLLYLLLISLLPDLRRVFQYHAAEHKAINAYEAGEELTPTNVQKFSLIHPRCGTAFLLWVMVIGIFVFAFVGQPAWYWLILSRILLLPVIAGIAYELIRFAGKHQGNPFLMTLLAPGLWLQRLTTRPADARPDRSLDPRAQRGASPRGRHHPGRAQGRGHGLMPRIVRRAAVAWEGSLSRGTGTATASSSGTFELPIDLPSRIADKPGKTSPEELLAAAHAGCYSTSLAGEIARAGRHRRAARRHLHDHARRGGGEGAPDRLVRARRCRPGRGHRRGGARAGSAEGRRGLHPLRPDPGERFR